METVPDELKYPVGKYQKPGIISDTDFQQYIEIISGLPQLLRKEVENLTDIQLDTEYRPGGWTIRQVVNHFADSHMNGLMRLKLALTEDNPTIKPYHEELWAELADSKSMPIEPALKMIGGIHQRWTVLLKSLNEEQLARTFIHPEHGRVFRIDENTALYAWHCRHHLAHITGLKKSRGWASSQNLN